MVKTEFILSLVINNCLLQVWEKESSTSSKSQNDFIKNGTIPQNHNFYKHICAFISPIYTFPWRETQLFTRQIKVRIGKSILFILFIKGKMPTLARNKHPSVHFFLHGPRLFHLSTEKVRVRSVGNGHQSGYSRADTLNKNINKRSKIFPYREKNTRKQWKDNLKYGKIKFNSKRFIIACYID